MLFDPEDGPDDKYPTNNINPAEQAAGFKRSTVPNPNHHAGEPRKYNALVCDLGAGRSAVKMKNPTNGEIEYSIISNGAPIDGPYSNLAIVIALKQLPAPATDS